MSAVETVPETGTGVWLDAATLEELQPPCESRKFHNGNQPPAEWAVWFSCPKCGLDLSLYCNGCKAHCDHWDFLYDSDCDTDGLVVVRVEKL